jgi:uncharacterized repeat protein (TIGR01451 family)
MLLLVPAVSAAQPPVKCPGPWSEPQLWQMVKGSIPAARIAQLVTSCGIDFDPTEQVLERLRLAGMSATVLAGVRGAIGPSRRKRLAEQALWESIQDRQDPESFERFLSEYPASEYAEAARRKLDALKPAPAAPAVEAQSIVVRPYVRARNAPHPVDVKVTMHFQGAAGEQSIPAVETADTYVAQAPPSVPGPVTIVAEDRGAGHFLPGRKDVGPPLPTDIPFELQFAKPLLSVVYNPNAQLARMEGGSTSEDDLKVEVWKLFQSLCTDPKWDKKFAYQYLMSTYELAPQKILVAREDAAPPFDAASRVAAFGEFHFRDQPVATEAAIRDFGDFLKGFGYPPDRSLHGVLVYILGAPPNPVLRDDPRLAEWDGQLREANMSAVVAAFLPGSPNKTEQTAPPDAHRHLRYLEFSAAEEAKFYFEHAFADIQSAIADLLSAAGSPRLTITSQPDIPDFVQGQNGVYTLTVSNAEDAVDSTGPVSVTDALPPGLQLVSIEGRNWSCNATTASCGRSDPLSSGKKYDPIAVKVSVSPSAPPSVFSKVTIAFGGSRTAVAEVPTTIRPTQSATTTYEYRPPTPDEKKKNPGLVRIEVTSRAGSITGKLTATDIPANSGLPKSTGYQFSGLRFRETVLPGREDEIEILQVPDPPSLELVWKDGRLKNKDALFDLVLRPIAPGQTLDSGPRGGGGQ